MTKTKILGCFNCYKNDYFLLFKLLNFDSKASKLINLTYVSFEMLPKLVWTPCTCTYAKKSSRWGTNLKEKAGPKRDDYYQ